MKTGTLLYIHNKDSILLVNFRKYGGWCCVGGYLGETGKTVYEAGLNAAKNLCGINPEIVNLRGKFTFNDTLSPNESSTYFVFEARVNKATLNINRSNLYNAKWVPIKKALNYKLFPNSERYLLSTYLKSAGYFDLVIQYSHSGVEIVRDKRLV
jgi:hypothetical protein